jgi:hypothetical protein
MTTTMKVTTMAYNDEGWLDIENEVILEIPNHIYDRYSNCYIITANMTNNTYHTVSDWIADTHNLNVWGIEILTNA